MSYNQPYRNPADDYSASSDKYKDSQRIYQRESTAYRSRIRSGSPERTSPSSSEPVLSSAKALSFLHSCGLDAEDLQTLAQLPEHLIAADTLPDLLAQIKSKKASNPSSSRSSALQASSSSRSWDDRSHTQLVEYPLDLPARQSYSITREPIPTWDDRWENAQQTSAPTCTYTSSDSNYVVEYNHLKDKPSYFDKASHATEPSRQKTSVVPQSYSSHSRDISQSSHLSSRDVSQSSHLSTRDASQSSHRSSRDVSQSSYLSNRDVSQSSHRSSRDVSHSSHLSGRDIGQSSHLSGRDIGQSSHLSGRDIGQSSHLSGRDMGQPSYLSSRDIGQPSYLSSRDIGQSSHLSGRDNGQSSHLSGRDIGQSSHLFSRDAAPSSLVSNRGIAPPNLLSSRDVGLPSLLSIRDLAPPSHLAGSDIGQSSHQRRTESAPRVPTRKEASDFHGKVPPVFPYACVLCEITVLSNKDWSLHIKGAQHANSQLSLVEKYPAWDQTIQSARRNEALPDRHTSRTTQERGGSSNSRNVSSGSKSAVSSSKSQTSSSQKSNKTEATTKCKVVCVKFEVDDVDEAYLKKLLGQFGAIVKIIMLPRMAFVNMGTAGQAEDIVKYFYQNPLRIRGELIVFTLSAAFNFLQTSRVVSFSPLPSGDGIRSELTAIAKRFGSVKNSLFLPGRGYVEMSSAEEADKLVEHYSTQSLKIKGKTITVCSSTEYQTLDTTDADEEKSPVSYSSRKRRRSCSPRRRSHRDSPSPKRRASEERSRSRRSQDSKRREESGRSRERTKESSRRDSSSKSRSKRSSPSKDQTQKTKTEDGVKKTVEGDNNQSDVKADDSDLEGVAVIADDGEALNSEDELTVDEDVDDEAHQTSDEQEPDASEHGQAVNKSVDHTKLSDMGTLSIKPEISECVPTATTSEGSSDCKEAQELQQGEQKEPQEKKEVLQQGEQNELHGNKQEQKELQQGEKSEQQGEQKDNTVEMEEAADFSENLDKEGVLTGKDDEMEISISSTEEQFGKVLEVAGFPVAKKYSEADLMKIGEKYGEVASCCLVRSSRKVEKALIEMVNAADAAKLEAECKKQHIKLGGRNLRITVSKKYSQLNEGQSVDADSEKEKVKEDTEENNKEPSSTLASCEESPGVMAEISEEGAEAQEAKETNMDTVVQTSSDEEEGYGRVLRIRNLPMPDEYTDAEFLNIAEPYGKVVRHWMSRLHRTGLIEMKNASDAEKVVAAANMNKITVAGIHPKILVSTKHAHLNKRDFLHGPSEGSVHPSSDFEEENDESETQNTISEQQASVQTSVNVEESSNDNQDDNSKGDEKQVSAADDGSVTKAENSDAVSEKQTPVMDPVGTEFVRPVVGYFCSLCNTIYASEEEAKNEHCRTPMHHQKLKEHKERST
ncbi:matrin 3-like 1.1 isoform X4 [Carassius gibelio]|uniref:matrin 3-like 1.1 isoform X4 n=1 Tax=Carassius gibelio TaxID=101364 RepID=UPI00227953FF|nr:matrin 3-like 1.1 isoform X4 [Carassius gibelio]